MTKGQKIFIGILSFLPLLFIVIFIIAFAFLMRDVIKETGPDAASFATGFIPFFILIALSSLLSFALLIYYIIHAVNNMNISGNERIVWILLFVFAGVIAFPIYWYMRIWNEKTINPPSTNHDNVIKI